MKKRTVAFVFQKVKCAAHRNPHGKVASLCWGPQFRDRPRHVNGAQLFRPETVVLHIGKPAVGSQPGWGPDTPSGFFHHFTVQRGDGVFARVNSTAGQLVFGVRAGLKGQKQRLTRQQHRINPRSAAILRGLINRLSVTADHFRILGLKVALTI